MPLSEIANLSLDKENAVKESPAKKDLKSPVKEDKLSAAIAERKRIDAEEPLLQVISIVNWDWWHSL